MTARSSRRRLWLNAKPAALPLEDRSVPAGNVGGLVTDGTLYLVGDDAANAVWVQGTGRGDVTVLSIDGTTSINGATSPAVFHDVTRGFHVAAGAGDDVDVI